jgi:hypothetical protein
MPLVKYVLLIEFYLASFMARNEAISHKFSIYRKRPLSISRFFAWVEANSKSLEFLCERHLYARGFSVFCPGGLFVTLYRSFSAAIRLNAVSKGMH